MKLIRNADVFQIAPLEALHFLFEKIREQSLDVRDESNLNKINHIDTHYGR